MYPREIFYHPDTCVVRYAIYVDGRQFIYVRHMEGTSLVGLVVRVLLGVRSLGEFMSRSVRRFFLCLGLVAPVVDGGSSPVGGEGLRDSSHRVPTARLSPVRVRVVHHCSSSLWLAQCV